jgi:peptide methionine sulfoxide reductase MsrA
MLSVSPDAIEHFLITLDPATGMTGVRDFGTDYEVAISAYAEAERADMRGLLNIVLISADSLATIEKTHSSYFPGKLRDLLAAARR